MFKKLLLFVVFFCPAFKSFGFKSSAGTDSLLTFINLSDQNVREKKLATYIKHYFSSSATDSLNRQKSRINRFISISGIENKKALTYFTEGVYQKRMLNLAAAQSWMIKAIENLDRVEDHYLLYVFFSNLAFIQTDKGDAIGAISSYRFAKREAVHLSDIRLQIIVNINISDIYYKNGFFKQALIYLRQAETICNKYRSADVYSQGLIYDNKTQIFFRTNKPDSIIKYNEKLKRINSKDFNAYTLVKRNNYFLCLLQGNLTNAIKLINAAQRDSLYLFNDFDKQSLADAFFKAGQIDSAGAIINQLLADPTEINHPEVKFHQYEMLGEISKIKNDHKLAAFDFKIALQQSEENVNRLTQVGNILSQIKIDEIEGAYIQRNETFKKELTWLTFAIVIAILIIMIIGLFYRNTKQKRHYEKLLFTTQKEELAFINSHDVRRHLSNILGIIDVLENSENKEDRYAEVEDHLFHSAESLDRAIKSFSEKLND